MTEFFDKDGKPMELLEWARTFEDDQYRQIAKNRVGAHTVSTVWNGFDAFRWSDDEPARIFSTGVFVTADAQKEGGFELVEEQTYLTQEEALQGHADLVKQCEEKKK